MPESEAPVVIVSSDTHIGPRLHDDLRPYCPAKHLEAFDHAVTGIGAVLKSEDGYATIEEVMHADGGQQIVFVDNLKPLLLRKTPYWDRPSLRGKFKVSPEFFEALPVEELDPWE
jgi:hypothetical protein